ncbi:Uncharacterised protein [Vibrio cholerae]|nr:Uncharacterised protein [Vibrio cholerae]
MGLICTAFLRIGRVKDESQNTKLTHRTIIIPVSLVCRLAF